ncbi:hypothetical protein C0J52_12148 [Blattella germanica]|nr:hypothetical protein C0J52_12148 [Blattella germanica]
MVLSNFSVSPEEYEANSNVSSNSTRLSSIHLISSFETSLEFHGNSFSKYEMTDAQNNQHHFIQGLGTLKPN